MRTPHREHRDATRVPVPVRTDSKRSRPGSCVWGLQIARPTCPWLREKGIATPVAVLIHASLVHHALIMEVDVIALAEVMK